MPERGFSPIKVNIVEEEGWQPYDPGNMKGVMGWASDNAWDDWKAMGYDAGAGLVNDLLDATFVKAERRRISPDDTIRLWEEMRENQEENLEGIYHAILDAHEWMWEEAYTPTDEDIAEAMERATESWIEVASISDFWKLVVAEEAPRKGPKEWTPRLTEEGLFETLEKGIRYHHPKGEYDRFIIFDWGRTEPVFALLAALKAKPEEGSRGDVLNDLQALADRYMSDFFKALEDHMQGVDTAYRTDFDKHWAFMLRDKQRLRQVRDEVRAFLKMASEPTEMEE